MDIASTIVSAVSAIANLTLPPGTSTEVQAASFPFTPYISQAEACKQAENRAKTLMLERVVGQTFTSDSSQSCKETNNNLSCKNYNVTTEAYKGDVVEIIDRKERVENWQCTVTLTAAVSKKQEVVDPNFDINVKMKQLVYMEKDTLRFSVTPNAGGALHVFRLDDNNKLTKIYPLTDYQVSNNVIYPGRRMEFPNDFTKLPVQSFKDQTDNATTLFIAYTYSQVQFLDSYELSNFYKLWDNMKWQKRLVKKSYVVTRSE